MTVVARASARSLVLLLAVIALLAASAWSAGPARAATGDPVYDSIPAAPPKSYPSLGYQATQTAEFGDLVELSGTDRDLQLVTVGLVSWACESGSWTAGCVTTPDASFSHPITVTIYEEGTAPAPGAEIATITKDVDVPFRPTSDSTCPAATQWRDPVSQSCQNGFLFLETFDFPSLLVSLPDRVIVTVAFNTNTWGYSPIGTTGPYDSLNVAVISSTPAVGTDVDTDIMYWSGGKPVSALAADDGWQTPTPQYGLALRIVATDLLATLPLPGGGNQGGGAAGGELDTLAVTGSDPSPLTGIAGLVVLLLGVALVALAPRRSGLHRA